MNVIDEARQIAERTVSLEQSSAERVYADLLQKIDRGEMDASSVAGWLGSAGRSIDDLEADIAVYQERKRMINLHQRLPDLQKARREAVEAEAQARLDHKKAVEEADAALRRAKGTASNATAELIRAQAAEERLRQLKPRWLDELFQESNRALNGLRSESPYEDSGATERWITQGAAGQQHDRLRRRLASLEELNASLVEAVWPLPPEVVPSDQ